MNIINWCTARWMECYELSAEWTVGITIVVGLYILSLFGDDEDKPAKPGLLGRMAANNSRESVRTPEPRRTAPEPSKKKVYKFSCNLYSPSHKINMKSEYGEFANRSEFLDYVDQRNYMDINSGRLVIRDIKRSQGYSMISE